MLLDVDALEARKTISDQYGVYHAYQTGDQVRSFLMFCCSTRKEALRLGEAVAKVLGVPFRDRLPALTKQEQEAEDRSESEGMKPPATDPSAFANYQVRVGKLGVSAPVASSGGSTGSGKQKVMGVGARIRELLAQGLSDSDIVNQCIPMYTAAGKTETVARNLLKPYVAEIRKLEVKKKEQYATVLGIEEQQ